MNDQNNLKNLIALSNLDESENNLLTLKFSDYETIAQEWEIKAKSITVTNISQTTEMKMAREARKFLSDKRIEIEKTRKALKEQSLRKGQAIDSIAKYLTSLIKPTEDYLKEQEDFIKIQEEKEAEKIRLETQKKLEEERIIKEKAEAEEREKMRLENERLKKEAAEREIEIKRKEEERNAQEVKEKAIRDEKERKEREEYETKLAKEREEKAKLEASLAEAEAIKRKELERQKTLALAPDKEKLQAFAQTILEMEYPNLESEPGKKVLENVKVLIGKVNIYITENINKL